MSTRQRQTDRFGVVIVSCESCIVMGRSCGSILVRALDAHINILVEVLSGSTKYSVCTYLPYFMHLPTYVPLLLSYDY